MCAAPQPQQAWGPTAVNWLAGGGVDDGLTTSVGAFTVKADCTWRE